jgi:hypothetical protein
MPCPVVRQLFRTFPIFHFSAILGPGEAGALYAGSTLTRVPRYRPISKAELGKRGLIYGTGSRAKRPHRLTVLLAAGEICLFAKQSATYKSPRHHCRPLPAGSFPGGFRTTAPVRVDSFLMGPSSETLICGEACQALSARQLLWFSIGCNERKPFSFLLLRFLLFDRATGFLPPRPWVSHADARRGCQGRPSLRHRSALRRFQAAP